MSSWSHAGLIQYHSSSVSSNSPHIFLESMAWCFMNSCTSIPPCLNPLAQSLNLLSSVNSLSLCLSLWGGISSFVNDAGGQGAPEELSAGFYEPSREAATPGERSESWRTTWLTMWLGFEYGACVLNAHRDGYWVLREQKVYGYTYVARTKIAHMALYSIFTIYTGWCMCIIYSYTIISSDLQQ